MGGGHGDVIRAEAILEAWMVSGRGKGSAMPLQFGAPPRTGTITVAGELDLATAEEPPEG
jgi:hypothetical protein